jgi:hypothetical protein
MQPTAPHPATNEGPTEVPPETLSLGSALGFAFRTEHAWMNILVTSLLSLVPLAGVVALEGWHAEISQRLVRRHPQPIPTFDFGDFIHYLMRGLQPFAVRYVIALPLSALIVIGIVAGFYAGAVSARGADPTALYVVAAVGGGVYLLVTPFFLIVTCVTSTRAELLEDFVKAFSPRAAWSYVRASWGAILVSHLALGIVAVVLSLFGLVACYVGLFVVSVVTQLAYVHLRWQLYERYLRGGGTPIEPKAPVWIPSELARARAAWTAQQHGQST